MIRAGALFVLWAVSAACPETAWAQREDVTKSASASLEVERPLSIAIISEVSFGRIELADEAKGGTVTVSANPELRPAVDGAVLRGASPAGPAKRMLSGEPGRAYRVILPPLIETGKSGSTIGQVTLHSATSGDISGTGVGQFDRDGNDMLRIGATLHLVAGSTSGNFNTPVPVTIVYE